MKKIVPIRQALEDPELLGHALPGDSWAAWRVLRVAAMGEALNREERRLFEALTRRAKEPGEIVETFLAVAGRRSGTSRAMAVLCTYLSTLVDWSENRSEAHRLNLIPMPRQPP